ncbi:MAG: hypothetical protein U0T81_03755 [Saprospiraceae bacterium]
MRQRGFLESELKVRDLVAAKRQSFYSVSPDSRLRDVLTMIMITIYRVAGNERRGSDRHHFRKFHSTIHPENPMKNADKAVSEIMSELMLRVSMDLPRICLKQVLYRKIPASLPGSEQSISR